MERLTTQTSVTPPTSISMEEYNATWKPAGWHLIIIGPTATWRTEWGMWEAIRDLVQNCLDETESYESYYDDQGLVIADNGKGVAIADFLLGPPKLKPAYARGRFGEGMKIACLTFLRSGHPVYIETVGRELWVIFLKQKVDGSADTLAALWRDGGTRQGTKFHIIGYRGDAYEDRFTINLPKSAVAAEAPSPLYEPIKRNNQLIKYGFPGGNSRIFSRDIYMRDINSPFSYNLWGFEMAPDRYGPKKESDMWIDIARLWCCIHDEKLLEELIKMIVVPPIIRSDEANNLSFASWGMGKEPYTKVAYTDIPKATGNKAAWQNAWRNVCGSNAVIDTEPSLRVLVTHLGYSPVGVMWGAIDQLSTVIKTDKQLIMESQARLGDAEKIPDSQLMSKHLANLRLAREISKRVTSYITIPIFAAIIPPASDRQRTAGMYLAEINEIYISPGQLDHATDTVDTVIHELAHQVSKASDGEPAHNRAMTKIAGQVVEYTSRGMFDDVIARGVVW